MRPDQMAKAKAQRLRARARRLEALGVPVPVSDTPPTSIAAQVPVQPLLAPSPETPQQAFDRLGGWVLIRQVVRLSLRAQAGTTKHHVALQQALKGLVPAWPAGTPVQDTTVLDIIQWVRSPDGFGKPHVNPQEDKWRKVRADHMSVEVEYDEFDRFREMSVEDRRHSGVEVHHIRHRAPITDGQRLVWYELLVKTLEDGSLQARIDRLERQYAFLDTPKRPQDGPQELPCRFPLPLEEMTHRITRQDPGPGVLRRKPFLLEERIRGQWVIDRGGWSIDQLLADAKVDPMYCLLPGD